VRGTMGEKGNLFYIQENGKETSKEIAKTKEMP
jgi:hypothetical protein